MGSWRRVVGGGRWGRLKKSCRPFQRGVFSIVHGVTFDFKRGSCKLKDQVSNLWWCQGPRGLAVGPDSIYGPHRKTSGVTGDWPSMPHISQSHSDTLKEQYLTDIVVLLYLKGAVYFSMLGACRQCLPEAECMTNNFSIEHKYRRQYSRLVTKVVNIDPNTCAQVVHFDKNIGGKKFTTLGMQNSWFVSEMLASMFTTWIPRR